MKNFIFSNENFNQLPSAGASALRLRSARASRACPLGGLVLGCIDADFCVQMLILQHFSRSTRFAILCTAPNSKSQQKFDQLFQISAEISAKIIIFQQFSWNFPPILMKIYRHFAKYFRKWSTSFKFHNF